jgi:sulfur-carrier protein
VIRVELPQHLRTLAKISGEVELEVAGPVTQRAVLDALEARYPMLEGTIRDHVTRLRRPFIRLFACQEDLSHELPDAPLPEAVVSGAEPLLIIGAIAGGSALTLEHDYPFDKGYGGGVEWCLNRCRRLNIFRSGPERGIA